MTIVSGSLLAILEEAGENILTLTEEIEPEAFFNSKITQHETMKQLRNMTETAANLPVEVKYDIAEVDWAGWSMLNMQLTTAGGFEKDAVWFAVRSLVPATLMWLRVYRKDKPEHFKLTP
jgi:uncharacterized protein with HEPN domain